ncbi:hypothetical protein KJE20_09779 [Pyrenophora tritici-repentis]|nr:hypothetical protein KJE20_09779 [Pyrenophora tritici-repentis]
MATTQPSARVPPIPLTNWGGFNPPGRGKTTSTVNDEYVQPFRGKFSGAPTQEKASEGGHYKTRTHQRRDVTENLRDEFDGMLWMTYATIKTYPRERTTMEFQDTMKKTVSREWDIRISRHKGKDKKPFLLPRGFQAG